MKTDPTTSDPLRMFNYASPASEPVTDADLRQMWLDAGGEFHGPKIETGTMPEAKLLPFLRKLAKVPFSVNGSAGVDNTYKGEPVTDAEVGALCVKLEHCYDLHPFAFEAKQAAALLRKLSTRLDDNERYIREILSEQARPIADAEVEAMARSVEFTARHEVSHVGVQQVLNEAAAMLRKLAQQGEDAKAEARKYLSEGKALSRECAELELKLARRSE